MKTRKRKRSKQLACDRCEKKVSPLKLVGGEWLCATCRGEK